MVNSMSVWMGWFTAPCKAPQDKAQSAVWIQADGNLARGVQFTLQLYRTAKCTDSRMRNLQQNEIHEKVKGNCHSAI